MKQQGKQSKRGTSQRPIAPQTTQEQNPGNAGQTDNTKPGVGKPGQQEDLGQGATDFHQSNHGRRGR
jgi:hypothetical protein